MASRGFKVSELELKSGNVSWLVTGTLSGRQVRRQFATRSEAEDFRDQQNQVLFGRDLNKAPVRTHLTNEQVRQAETVFALLGKRSPELNLLDLERFHAVLAPATHGENIAELAGVLNTLSVKAGESGITTLLRHYQEFQAPIASQKTLHEAVMAYLEDREREVLAEKPTLSAPQYESIGKEMARLQNYFGGERLVSLLSPHDLHQFIETTFLPKKDLQQPRFTNKTWNNRRGYLTTFFKFCVGQGWMAQNPAQAIRVFKRVGRGTPCILSASQAAELMTYLEENYGGRLVPFFALALFAGIRPDWKRGEISKIEPRHFVQDEQHHCIALPMEDTKTGKPRNTTIQPNLAKWLEAYPIKEYPIIACNFKKLYLRVRKKFSLGHDVLRHTYCSMLLATCRSVGEAALQAGNSEAVLWESYLSLVKRQEAIQFWSILPKRARAPEKAGSLAHQVLAALQTNDTTPQSSAPECA